jgi:hypothetical protein
VLVVDVIRDVAVSSPVPRIKIPGSAVVLGVVYTHHTVSGLSMSWRVQRAIWPSRPTSVSPLRRSRGDYARGFRRLRVALLRPLCFSEPNPMTGLIYSLLSSMGMMSNHWLHLSLIDALGVLRTYTKGENRAARWLARSACV